MIAPLLAAVCCFVSGHIDAPTGSALSGVAIHLAPSAGHTAVQSTVTDAAGEYRIQVDAGTYEWTATVPGYAPSEVRLALSHDARVDATLAPLDAPTVRTIATVRVDGTIAAPAGTVPSVTYSRTDMERLGVDRVVTGLMQYPSVTFAHPHGGASTGIATIALRGPDPSETLIGLDGQVLNDANTGDLDLSRFPTAAFSSADITEGLGAQDRQTSNTIGGEVNFITLQPTAHRHSAFSASTGSFGRSDLWLNATGTLGRLGYALAGDSQSQRGYVNETQPVYDPANPGNPPQNVPLGSNASARSMLVNVGYAFSKRAALTARVFALADRRDLSSAVNGIDNTAGSATNGLFIGPGAESIAQIIRAYQIRGRAPLGSGVLVADVSRSDNDARFYGGVSNALYDLGHTDKRSTESLSWERDFEAASFAFGATLRQETFVAPGTFPQLSQVVASYFVRGGRQLGDKLRADAAIYNSHYTTFGSTLDGRLGLTYETSPLDRLRFSAGTGFRAPLLVERYVFDPSQLPPADANCIVAGQGNPNEKPERATEYELGATHRIAQGYVDVSLYRTNLRNPIENYYPVPACPAVQYSYPINIGAVVYEGAEVRYVQRLPLAHLLMRASYGLNVAYPYGLPVTVSNPTSGAYLVNGAQFQNIPQQQAAAEVDYEHGGLHAAYQSIFRGKNNELNRSPFTLVNAAVGYATKDGIDLTLAATNIFSEASGRYTMFGGGIPYRGNGPADPANPLAATPTNLPTNLYSVEPFALRLILTVRR